MSRQNLLRTGLLFMIGWLLFGVPVSAQAQTPVPTPENDANCVSCHTHRYYLYDEGKWFCLCEAPMHCVYCHGGRNDSLDKTLAHQGLVLYPTENEARRCQGCHSQDYLARVISFSGLAGIVDGKQGPATLTQTPVAVFASAAPGGGLASLNAGQGVLLGTALIALLGFSLYSWRCWRNDCLERKQTQPGD